MGVAEELDDAIVRFYLHTGAYSMSAACASQCMRRLDDCLRLKMCSASVCEQLAKVQ